MVLATSGHRDIGVSGIGLSGYRVIRDIGILGYQDIGVSGFRGIGFSGYRVFGVSGLAELARLAELGELGGHAGLWELEARAGGESSPA